MILGGVAVFERGIHHLIKGVDDCVTSFDVGDQTSIELHGSAMYNGRDGVWRTIKERPLREKMILKALATLHPQRKSIRLFAAAIDKAAVSPHDPVEVAFEQICSRFNLFLQRISNRERNGRTDGQRGLIVMDNMSHAGPLQALARHFRSNGGRFGHYRHLVEVPLFVDSKATRLVQIADLVAWATWRKYEHHDGRFFDPIIPFFDSDGGIVHGLYHHRQSTEACYCPACSSRTNFRQPARVVSSRERA